MNTDEIATRVISRPEVYVPVLTAEIARLRAEVERLQTIVDRMKTEFDKSKACCNHLWYREHEPDCWLMIALAAGRK